MLSIVKEVGGSQEEKGKCVQNVANSKMRKCVQNMENSKVDNLTILLQQWNVWNRLLQDGTYEHTSISAVKYNPSLE